MTQARASQSFGNSICRMDFANRDTPDEKIRKSDSD
jgi:hypothetical protein